MDDHRLPTHRPDLDESRGVGDDDVIGSLERSVRERYRNIELAVREGTMLVGHDGRVVDSRKIDLRLGIDAADVVGDHPLPAGWKMFDDDDVEVDRDDHPAIVAMRTGQRCEQILSYQAPGADRERRRLRFVANPLLDDPLVAVDLVISDHDRRADARRLLESQDTRFRTMTDMLAVAVWESTTSGEITYVNPKFVELTGLDAALAPDLPMLGLVHPDDVLSVMQAAGEAALDGEYRTQYRLQHVDGSSRWVSSRMSVLMDDDGTVTGYVGVIENIDDLRRSEQRARRLADIVEAAVDAVMVFDNRRLTYVNPSAASLLTRLDSAFTTNLAEYEYSGRLLEYLASIEALLVDEGTWTGDADLVDLDGVRVDLALTVNTEFDDDSVRHVVMAHDIRERKIREAELTHNAAHDPLTGLANRHRLSEVIAESDGEMPVGLLFVDLDHFKRVNDQHGHAAGDRVLVVAAQRVVSVVGAEHLVARVGGDEMVVWAPGVTDLEALAQRIVDVIDEQPVHLEGMMYAVSATVGGALGRAQDHGELMRRADEALYAAKANGRRCWRIHDGRG